MKSAWFFCAAFARKERHQSHERSSPYSFNKHRQFVRKIGCKRRTHSWPWEQVSFYPSTLCFFCNQELFRFCICHRNLNSFPCWKVQESISCHRSVSFWFAIWDCLIGEKYLGIWRTMNIQPRQSMILPFQVKNWEKPSTTYNIA